MSKKLKSLAISFSKRKNLTGTLNEIYNEVRNLLRNLPGSTKLLSPSEMIQLIFYIKDLQKPISDRKTDEIFSNIYYVGLILMSNFFEEVDCEKCGADDSECDYCENEGYYETDNREYTLYNILSTSELLNYKSEKTLGKPYSTISETSLYDLMNQNKVIILSKDIGSVENYDLVPERMYCVYSDYDANLSFDSNLNIYFVTNGDVKEIFGR